MRDTKKLRKVTESSLARSDSAMGQGGDLFEKEFRRAKKLHRSERLFEDSWSQLLGEPRESQKAFYERGSWNLEDGPLEEKQDGIFWDSLPTPRADSVSEDSLLGIKRVDSSVVKKLK